MLSIGYLLLLFINKSESFLRNRCLLIYNLCFTTKYPLLKKLLCIPIGFTIGFVFYSYVVFRFSMEPKIESVFRYAIVSLITIMFTVSVQMRAICCLILPTFLGRSTRNFLIASVVISLVNNPITNTFENSVIFSKWMYCMVKVGVEQGKEASTLFVVPTQQFFTNLIDEPEILTNNSRLKSIVDKFESKNSKSKSGTKSDAYQEYVNELNEKCEKYKYKIQNCYSELITPMMPWYIKALSLFTPMSTIHWSLQTSEKMGWFRMCDFERLNRFLNMSCNLRSNYSMANDTSLKTAIKGLKDFASDNIKVNHSISFPDLSKALEFKSAFIGMQYFLKNTKDFCKLSANVVKTLFLVVFAIVFFSSKSYHNNYLKDISFDNIYITNYFRRIDARRKKAGKLSLLPLKKIEKIDVIDPFSWKLTKKEKSFFKTSTILLVFLFIFIYLILLIDSFLYDLIDLISIHFNIDVLQYGYNEMHPKVTNEDQCIRDKLTNGYMFTTMTKLFKLMDFQIAILKKTTFAKCRPTPTRIHPEVADDLYKDFWIICFLNYLEMYSLRTRRVICSYFYRIRAKKRTLFLYNKILKRRKGFLRYSIQRVRQLVRQKIFEYPNDQIVNTFVYGLINENNCGFLVKTIHKVMSFFFKKRCIVCDEKLNKNQKYFKCSETKCNLNYCNQCWDECHQRCLVCKPVFFTDL